MWWVTRASTVGGCLIVLAALWGGLVSLFHNYHQQFAQAVEFKQLGKDYAEFTKTTRIGDKKAERREIIREIMRIKRIAHGRPLLMHEAEQIREKELQITEIQDDIAELKGLKRE